MPDTAQEQEWDSGVGGAQCDTCGRTTTVRALSQNMFGDPEFWSCRPCAFGDVDEDVEW